MDNIFSHFKNHQNHQNFLGGGKLSVRGEVYGERLCPKSCVDAHFCAVLCSCCSMRKPCANPIFIYLFVGDQAPTPPHLLSDYLAGGAGHSGDAEGRFLQNGRTQGSPTLLSQRVVVSRRMMASTPSHPTPNLRSAFPCPNCCTFLYIIVFFYVL